MRNPFTAERIRALTQRVWAATTAQLIALTRQKTAENQAAIREVFGRDAETRLYVDGVLGKPLEDVNPGGFTHTEFDVLASVVDAAIRRLIEGSPYGPAEGGHYQDDHWLFVNGIRRDAREGATVGITRNDEVVIMNMRPYARKIEGGRTRAASRRDAGRTRARRPGLSVQAPNGVYEIAARDLQRRFGNVARIRFTYRGLIGGAAPGRGRRADRYPALIITAPS